MDLIEIKIDLLSSIDSKMENINKKLDKIDTRLSRLENILILNKEECKKMGGHIDLIENIYENVKHPLGFLCNNIKYYVGNETEKYSLDNK